ncbi:VOC family protein [Kordiimonas sp.]|uniref:VOC family protein n=1 Tax=Kordiimonas sp. TaxID=1970157 RepID=UPI003A8EA26B
MAVKRIVSNLATENIEVVKAFYQDIFDLDIVMDHGWIVTLSPSSKALVQVSIATEGGSGTAVPDLSIEVDNLDEVYERAKSAGHPITYGPAEEPWGVRRFYVEDPTGRILNVLTHL